MSQKDCATLSSAKRLAAFEELEKKLRDAPFVVLSLLDKAWDKEQEIFDTSIPNSKAGAAAKLKVVFDSQGLFEDPEPFTKPLASSLRRFRGLLRESGTRKQLICCAKQVRPLLEEADRSFMTDMVETVLVAVENDYSEFGEPTAKAKSARRKAAKNARASPSRRLSPPKRAASAKN